MALTLVRRDDPKRPVSMLALATPRGTQTLAGLNVVRGAGLGQTFMVTNAATRIGRRGDCQVVVSGSTVSRVHCEIVLGKGGRLFVRDLGSTFGTKLNGTRLEPGVLTPLGHGDALALGWSMVLRVVPPASRSRKQGAPQAFPYTDEATLRRALADELVKSRMQGLNLTLIYLACAAAAPRGRGLSSAATTFLGEQIGAALRRRLGANERVWQVGPAQFVVTAAGRSADDVATASRRIAQFVAKMTVQMSGEVYEARCGLGAGIVHPRAKALAATLVAGARGEAFARLDAARQAADDREQSRHELESVLSRRGRDPEAAVVTGENPASTAESSSKLEVA
jgi:hypothetical protein